MPKRRKHSESKAAAERTRPQKGDGILDFISKLLSRFRPGTISSKFKATLQKYGNQKISKIVIGRDPLNSLVAKAANWITGGNFEKKLKELGYDNAFHLYMLITLADGTNIVLEKNQIPQMTVKTMKPQDSITVASPGNTLAEFVDNTIKRMGEKDYTQYDAATLNCQNFVENHLKANGISTPEATKFIMQQADQLLTGKARSAAKAVTDIAAIFTQAIGGKKKKKKTRKASQHGGGDIGLNFPARLRTSPYGDNIILSKKELEDAFRKSQTGTGKKTDCLIF